MSQLNIWPTFQPELGDSNSKLRNDETQTEEKTINIHAYFTQVAVSSWTSLHSYNQTSEMEGSKLRDWNTRLNKLKYLSYEDNSNEKNKWKVKRWEVLKNARWHLYGLSMWEQRQMETIAWVFSLWTRGNEDERKIQKILILWPAKRLLPLFQLLGVSASRLQHIHLSRSGQSLCFSCH